MAIRYTAIMPDRSCISNNIYGVFDFLDHRACAALRAAVLRCSGVMLAVLAGPPFNPPSRPSATAAGFFFDFELVATSSKWHAFIHL
jgi:hypothetical protein